MVDCKGTKHLGNGRQLQWERIDFIKVKQQEGESPALKGGWKGGRNSGGKGAILQSDPRNYRGKGGNRGLSKRLYPSERKGLRRSSSDEFFQGTFPTV